MMRHVKEDGAVPDGGDPLDRGDPEHRSARTRRDVLRTGGLLAAGGLAAMLPAQVAHAETVSTGGAGAPGSIVTSVYRGHSPFGFDQWAYIPFDVPPGVNRISVKYTYHEFVVIDGILHNVLDIGIFDPNGFRGWSGGARSEFTLSGADSTPAYVRGPITPGKWAIAQGPIVYDPAGMDWEVTVTLEYGPPLPEWAPDKLWDRLARGAGWYRGDMHIHSHHSDSGRTVDELVAEARASRLDFFATSDHNTNSTGLSWRGNIPSDMLVINGEEVTTRHGHWLAIGIPQGEWLDWRYAPSDSGAFGKRSDRVRTLGGLVMAAHPLTPGPGSFWEFGYDRIDALEVWNGDWRLDNEAALFMWSLMLRVGKWIPAVGNSDSHGAGQPIGLPQNVVRATSLSKNALLDGIRLGHSYIAESADVALSFVARAGGREAGPGDDLGVSLFEGVEVTARVTGAPNTIMAIHTEWGVMAVAAVDGSGIGQLTWKGWGKASIFARVEVRRPKPGTSTLDQMVCLSNPVWFNMPPLPTVSVEQQTFFQTVRYPSSWTEVRALPGAATANTFTGTCASVAGPRDGTIALLGVSVDGCLWLVHRDLGGNWRNWRQVMGPDGQPFKAREAAIADLPDGTCQMVATSTNGTLHHQTLKADGSLTGFVPVPGNGKPTWTAVKADITGMPDGSSQVVTYGSDGLMYLNIRKADGAWGTWTIVPGGRGYANFAGPALAITGLRDGSSQLVAIGLDGLLYHQVRHPDGRYDGFATPAGVTTPVMSASSVDIAGMPDGSAQVVAVGADGNVWHNIRYPDRWQGFMRVHGLGGSGNLPGGHVAIAALPGGNSQLVVISPS